MSPVKGLVKAMKDDKSGVLSALVLLLVALCLTLLISSVWTLLTPRSIVLRVEYPPELGSLLDRATIQDDMSLEDIAKAPSIKAFLNFVGVFESSVLTYKQTCNSERPFSQYCTLHILATRGNTGMYVEVAAGVLVLPEFYLAYRTHEYSSSGNVITVEGEHRNFGTFTTNAYLAALFCYTLLLWCALMLLSVLTGIMPLK